MSALTIRIDPSLEAMLDQAVLHTGLTKSELVRQAITEKMHRTIDPDQQARLWARAANLQAPEHNDFFAEV